MGAICLSGGGPGFDLDQAAAENREFLSTRTSEKQEMILLNDRLAAYIEKASAQWICTWCNLKHLDLTHKALAALLSTLF